MWLRNKENLDQGEKSVETPTVPEKTLADEPVFNIVKRDDLEKHFDPAVLADTKRLKEAMDQSWDEIINQFNGLLTVNYREEMTKQSPVKYLRLTYPMPKLVDEALKKATQPIEGNQLAGEHAVFNQVITESYENSSLKPAIEQSDFELRQFYIRDRLMSDELEFVILLETKA
ncbi:hypothetical protein [Leuconostoc mesenteroides]|uniref:hypothetical protein n=1 Tax=Leuconostoc mesenteroides TaxID=1245 RepID=UPI000681C346|nr:hypothetical protein [Leuconostoc mesenteroides]KMY76849.1 hypothetical protein WZ79_10285 [Leuconostoc mesenteroides subsp. mesenteroides]